MIRKLPLLGCLLLAPLLAVNCASPAARKPLTGLISKDGREIIVDSNQEPIHLQNNPEAQDVPFQRVLTFVRSNRINMLKYTPGKFVCSEFAVALHDAAEAAGIRCALVTVKFERGPGHGLNAFQTTDQGLIYVDCTGSPHPTNDPECFDTIAYLEVGKAYGRLHLDLAATDPIHYERYVKMMKRVEEIVEKAKAAELMEQNEAAATKSTARSKGPAPAYGMNEALAKSVDVWWYAPEACGRSSGGEALRSRPPAHEGRHCPAPHRRPLDWLHPVLLQEPANALPIRCGRMGTDVVNERDQRQRGGKGLGTIQVNDDDPAAGPKHAVHFGDGSRVHRHRKVVKHHRAEHHVE